MVRELVPPLRLEGLREAPRETSPSSRKTGFCARRSPLRARKLHKRLHTQRTLRSLQIDPNTNQRRAALLQSPLTDSNRRPPPYHGGALPTELRGRGREC